MKSKRMLKNIYFVHDIILATIENYKCFRLDQSITHRTINIELNFISNLLITAKEWGMPPPIWSAPIFAYFRAILKASEHKIGENGSRPNGGAPLLLL